MDFFIGVGPLAMSRPPVVVLLTEDGFILSFEDQFAVFVVEV